MRYCYALLASVAGIAALAAQFGERQEVPAGAKVHLVLDKQEYFLGENILAHLCIENTGTQPFSVNTGGDYRGATRHLRFHVSAKDETGNEMRDPDPSGFSMGGISSSSTVKPGDKFYLSEPLLRYRHFEKPGTYKLRVGHDLGWKGAPVAEGTIKLVMPSPEQARKIVDEMDRLPRDTSISVGEKRPPYADFRTLAYPVYLPILALRAETGSNEALQAIAQVPSPAATQTLIDLTVIEELPFVRKVLQNLNWRLPDPQLEDKLGGRNVFVNDHLEARRWLLDRSWKAEFAPKVKAIALKLLTADAEVETLECAAFALQCLGQKEDAPALVRGLDRAIALIPGGTERNRGYAPKNACNEFFRVAKILDARGMTFPREPKTPAEKVLFMYGLAEHQDFRPAGWQGIYAGLLQDKSAYVRERALFHLPRIPLKEGSLPKLLRDESRDVVLAACRAAAEIQDPGTREPLTTILKTSKDPDLLEAADGAAYHVLPKLERMQILASRLDEKEVSYACLEGLSHVLTGWNSRSLGFDGSEEKLRALKNVWQKFIADHMRELSTGKQWQFDDPSIPVGELMPGFTFQRYDANMRRLLQDLKKTPEEKK